MKKLPGKTTMPGLLAYSVRIGEALDLRISRELRRRVPGISRAQAEVLLLLERKKTMDMGSLSRELQKDPGTMTSVVQALWKKGLLERRSVEGNRRTQEIQLLPEGNTVSRRCLALYRNLEKELQADIPGFAQILSEMERFYTQLKEKGYWPYPD